MKKAAFLLSLIWVGISGSNLNASSGTEGASFLDIPVGAGPAALGSAYSAAAKDAYAPIYNPAGLGFITHPQFAGQHLDYLESIHHEFGSFVIPLGRGSRAGGRETLGTRNSALGTSIQYLGSGDISGTGTSGEPIGNFAVHYAAYSLAYGRQITESLALGLTGKLIDAKIADTSAKAYAVDAGAMLQAQENLVLSATVNNLGTKLTFTDQGDSLPTALHLGAAYDFETRLKTTVEGVYSTAGLLSARTGIEWNPMELVSLRTGYKTDTVKGLSALAGLTVGMGLHVFGQEFAYAWLPYGALGDTQYFSMLLKFGAQEEKQRNLIEYQTLRTHLDKDGSKFRTGSLDLEIEPEFQQLMQLLAEEPAPERNALAPIPRASQ